MSKPLVHTRITVKRVCCDAVPCTACVVRILCVCDDIWGIRGCEDHGALEMKTKQELLTAALLLSKRFPVRTLNTTASTSMQPHSTLALEYMKSSETVLPPSREVVRKEADCTIDANLADLGDFGVCRDTLS